MNKKEVEKIKCFLNRKFRENRKNGEKTVNLSCRYKINCLLI